MKTFVRLALAGALLFIGSAAGPVVLDDPAIGLWMYRTSYPTGLKGSLVLTRKGSQWHAEIAGVSADAVATGNDIHIVFPNDGGALRGTLDHGVLHGFWVRREVTEDPNFPFGESQFYSNPLDLQQSRGRWRAIVAPLDDTFTLYLKVFRDSDGSLKAAFRNPELNSRGPAAQMKVERDGDQVRFSAQPDPAKPTEAITATLLHNPDRISVRWDDLKKSIELTRVAPEDATRFFPVPPGSKPYIYRMPPKTRDGWKVARARDVGMDEAQLARAVQHIEDIDPASARAWLIHSMLVARHGKLVLDEYFYGYGRDEPHDTRSASKTFSAIILGALMKDGVKISPSTRMTGALASLKPFANPDPRKERITLGHLLTHTAGFACDDNADSSPGNEDMLEADRTHPDWTRVTVDLPMAYDPGTHYAYCSMNINLAGAMLSHTTGEWLPELFDRTVARPLQFGPYYWNLQGSGEGYLGGGTFVRSRDFLKVGQAYLDGGVWNGRRIATPAWVKTSTSEQTHISPASTGRQGDAFITVYYDTGDGYAWHLYKVKSGDKYYPAYFANGAGGQLLIVMPEFDLVAMFTAGNYGQGVWNRERDDILGDMILPAIMDEPTLKQSR
jgi:CubicO group peptidase (beta-lactamase class C family)